MEPLERALLANRDEVERAIEAATEELTTLRSRMSYLEQLIQRGRVALGVEGYAPPTVQEESGSHVTLHEAMRKILARHPTGLRARELADEINRSGAYQRRDSSPIDLSQIHARVHAYPSLFIRENRRIRNRQPGDPG